MTRRECFAALVRKHESWKQRHHYREGSLLWQMGADELYPWSLWIQGRIARQAPAGIVR